MDFVANCYDYLYFYDYDVCCFCIHSRNRKNTLMELIKFGGFAYRVNETTTKKWLIDRKTSFQFNTIYGNETVFLFYVVVVGGGVSIQFHHLIQRHSIQMKRFHSWFRASQHCINRIFSILNSYLCDLNV